MLKPLPSQVYHVVTSSSQPGGVEGFGAALPDRLLAWQQALSSLSNTNCTQLFNTQFISKGIASILMVSCGLEPHLGVGQVVSSRHRSAALCWAGGNSDGVTVLKGGGDAVSMAMSGGRDDAAA